jgi:hypothetical protein
VTNNVFNSKEVVKKVQKNDLLSDPEDEPFSVVDNELNPNNGPNLPTKDNRPGGWLE